MRISRRRKFSNPASPPSSRGTVSPRTERTAQKRANAWPDVGGTFVALRTVPEEAVVFVFVDVQLERFPQSGEAVFDLTGRLDRDELVLAAESEEDRRPQLFRERIDKARTSGDLSAVE